MDGTHIHIGAFTQEKVDISQEDTVMIAGTHNGKSFKCYERMDVFFERFVNQPVMPSALPGLTPYKSRRHPKVRWKFDPARFGSSLEKWRDGPGELFNTLMGGGKAKDDDPLPQTAQVG